MSRRAALCGRHPQATFARYKFAFTPENSNDEGYVTEKVYDALRAGERVTLLAVKQRLVGDWQRSP